MVPPPGNEDQRCRANDDGPPDEPEHVGLPHGRREHDKRRPDEQAKSLFYVVRSRRAREGHEESLGKRRFRENDPRERDEEDTARDNHDTCD
jgi:hypothetical protein